MISIMVEGLVLFGEKCITITTYMIAYKLKK